jgi:hypothetical protein
MDRSEGVSRLPVFHFKKQGRDSISYISVEGRPLQFRSTGRDLDPRNALNDDQDETQRGDWSFYGPAER